MMTAKIFENGRSQAVRLPKEYRFEQDEVSINKIGSIVLLMPKNEPMEGFLKGLNMFTGDFMESGRYEETVQERELL